MALRKSILVASALVVWAGVTFAQAPATTGSVESKLEVGKVVVKDGKESIEPAGTARPGDLLQYTARYTNKGRASVSNLEATLPIPANTELVIESIKPTGAKASTGGTTFGEIPLKRKVRQANGVEYEQVIPVREYRALRWSAAEIPGEKTATFVARVRVLQDATINAPPAK